MWHGDERKPTSIQNPSNLSERCARLSQIKVNERCHRPDGVKRAGSERHTQHVATNQRSCHASAFRPHQHLRRYVESDCRQAELAGKRKVSSVPAANVEEQRRVLTRGRSDHGGEALDNMLRIDPGEPIVVIVRNRLIARQALGQSLPVLDSSHGVRVTPGV